MSERQREYNSKMLSHLVQVGFLFGVILLWFLATTRWGVSHLLLPNPVDVWYQFVDVISTGEFIGDLEVTLGELAIAFLISMTSGITIGYVISRSPNYTRVSPALQPSVSGGGHGPPRKVSRAHPTCLADGGCGTNFPGRIS